MKTTPITVETLFNDLLDKLNWQWVAGKQAGQRQLDSELLETASSAADLVGFLNYIRPQRIQVLGARELAYLAEVSSKQLLDFSAPIFILSDGQTPPNGIKQAADNANIALFVTQESAAIVVDTLRAYLSRQLAQQINMHGVFMDIFGLGVLITGDSGIGKSELGLELVSRGNGLVADDVVDLFRINQNSIEGSCPQLLQNLLEVRGIGLLDIKAIFGEAAMRRQMLLHLIVHLVRKQSFDVNYERLPTKPMYQNVLGIPVRKTIIEVAPGRNLAVLVEAAVRNYILQLRGIDTYAEFTQRQRVAMADGNL